jgi:hypothetical protein
VPRYNPYAKRRELAGPDETLHYNPYNKKREYAPEGTEVRATARSDARSVSSPCRSAATNHRQLHLQGNENRLVGQPADQTH